MPIITYRYLVGEHLILKHAILTDCRIKHSSLQHCTITDCVIVDCVIGDSIIKRCTVQQSDLNHSAIKRCTIQQSLFKNCTIKQSSMAPNPLTAMLPPEIRVKVYEFVLSSPYPVKRQIFDYVPQADHVLERRAAAGSEATLDGISLLLVDRLAYQEALPLLYKVNTFRVSRHNLCANVAPNSLTLLNPNHLVHIELSDLVISRSCLHLDYTNWDWPQCGTCAEPGFGLLYMMASIPHLRTAVVEYGTRRPPRTDGWFPALREPFPEFPSKRAFFRLQQAIRARCHSHHNFELTCVGIGEYQVQSAKLKNATVTFRDSPLMEAWSKMVLLVKAATESWDEAVANLDRDMLQKLIKLQLGVVGFEEAQEFVYVQTDMASVPQYIARIWPPGVPLDIAGVAAIQSPGLMEAFDNALQTYIDEPDEFILWVPVTMPQQAVRES
ncbi:hypothetical protein LTR36_008541 [Oleoguttula mirabilis]|uniref:Uncharacterized protein n=1 Tax=Oleoguttula mirabilis TaxID=1507867 RepID=A0AAV9JTA7_9PEZI|nr:hypothetical protein LTR36_008541 [Oleoguttula mirabilis]